MGCCSGLDLVEVGGEEKRVKTKKAFTLWGRGVGAVKSKKLGHSRAFRIRNVPEENVLFRACFLLW